MGRTKSLVEKIFDDFAEAYAESNRVALHWMEQEYLELKKQQNDKTIETDDSGIKEDKEAQKFRVEPNDGDTQIDTSTGY